MAQRNVWNYQCLWHHNHLVNLVDHVDLAQKVICTQRSSPRLFSIFRRGLRSKRSDRECSPQFWLIRDFHLPSILFINIQSKVSLVISARVLGFLLHMNCGEVWFGPMSGCGLCTEVQWLRWMWPLCVLVSWCWTERSLPQCIHTYLKVHIFPLHYQSIALQVSWCVYVALVSPFSHFPFFRHFVHKVHCV